MKDPGVPPPVCQEIRRIRSRVVGLSQEVVARELGISLKAYRAYETYREPRLARLRQIEELFGMGPGALLAFTGPPAQDGALQELRDEIARRHDQVLDRLDRLEELVRRVSVAARDGGSPGRSALLVP